MFTFSKVAIIERDNKVSVTIGIHDTNENCRYTLSLALAREENPMTVRERGHRVIDASIIR
ncbi:hypothetical protein QA644_24685 (plasmid) [Rhizobium sp. CC1099]|uniref:hypothetical protein n=1 Tax=Rhizobium sp. CC1099 TaxID=3039160 RepID=UPI0024B11DF9|nr:hypothetical protein [Rhizobium sp. CC1099]WFU91366.1 hypothetical protein QA644_24685 [Rhizobium sp. CC1099]